MGGVKDRRLDLATLSRPDEAAEHCQGGERHEGDGEEGQVDGDHGDHGVSNLAFAW